jgi:hypothetical protein
MLEQRPCDNMNEYQVPLVELLKSVPTDARFVQQEEFSSAYYPVGTLCHQAADRIAELEKRHTTLQTQFDNLYELANSGDEMHTEPVAWLVQYPDRHEFRWKKPEHLYEAIGCEPLYTHPVKEQDESFDRTASHMAGEYVSYTKELTDEEILEAWQEAKHTALNTKGNFVEVLFARAILRKARKK